VLEPGPRALVSPGQADRHRREMNARMGQEEDPMLSQQIVHPMP
jgi:hypothetical protein